MRSRRPCLPLVWLSFVALIATTAFAAKPPTEPLPRIEAGQHTAPIKRIGVDAKGRWLVTASHDKTARLWSLKTGELVRVLRPPIGRGNEGKLYAAALSPDGDTVAVGGWTGAWEDRDAIYVFDRETGELSHRVRGLPNVIRDLAFSPDGSRLAAALARGGIRLYRTDTWEEIGRDEDCGSEVSRVAFDGKGRLASVGDDGLVRLYDPDLRLIAKARDPGGERPFGLAFSQDGARIAVSYSGIPRVQLLSGKDLYPLYVADTAQFQQGELGSLAWSADGRILFGGGRYRDSRGRGHPLVIWPDAGRGSPRELPIANDTIMDLKSVADGGLAYATADPAWGLLDAGGNRVVGRGSATADFRQLDHSLRLSDDGMVVELDFRVFGADQGWQEHVLRLDLASRRLELDPGGRTEQVQRRLRELVYDPGAIDGLLGPRTRSALRAFQREHNLPITGDADFATSKALGLPPLEAPRTEAANLRIEGWMEQCSPRLEGGALNLEGYETSLRLDIAEGAQRFLLGTDWNLRLYQRDGTLLWKTPVPSSSWMVNLSGDGRWAVAAFGDGSVRWYDAENGHERLALFVDGAAIAKTNGSPGTSLAEAAVTDTDKSAVPWILRTAEGFFFSANGGATLMGWHLNRGADQAGELVDAAQISERFYRPDLIEKALSAEYSKLADAALSDIGDLHRLLSRDKAPVLERIGEAQVHQAGRRFETKLLVKNRDIGVDHIEYRVNGVVVHQQDFRGRFGPGLPNRAVESRVFHLDPGSNHIEAIAVDAEGRLRSTPAKWRVEVTGETGPHPALRGLAVGIGSYRDRTLDLRFGDDDAHAFARTLRSTAHPLFREVEIRELVNEQATLRGIEDALNAMAQKTQPQDVFVLFLAGHGLAHNGRYHYLPWDLIYSNREALRQGSLDEGRLRNLLAKVPAKKSLLVLDTCHAGAAVGPDVIADASQLRGGGAAETKAAIDRLMAATGRAVLASSTERTYALEGWKDHGLFTWVLLEGLRGAADANGDDCIETTELDAYLSSQVPAISLRAWCYRQFPMFDLQGQSFPIAQRPVRREAGK